VKSRPAAALFLALCTAIATAHPGHEDSSILLFAQAGNPNRAATVNASENRVAIVTNGEYRLLTANGLPDHAPGQFPNRGNPNAISAQSYTFRVTLRPQTNATPRSGQGAWFGVALNGVPFEPGTAEFWNGQRDWNFEAQSGFIDLGLDVNNAHVQPNGAYHYHGLPIGLMAKIGGEGKRMMLVGYAADGFPIYTSYGYSNATNAASPLKKLRPGWQLKKGTRPAGPGGNYDGKFTADYEYVPGSGDLDECNGRWGVTPESPQGTYYYCITTEFPQLARQWRGTPNETFFKRGPGPGGPGGPNNRRPPPPRQLGAPPPPPRG
jgi:hypothetical protein